MAINNPNKDKPDLGLSVLEAPANTTTLSHNDGQVGSTDTVIDLCERLFNAAPGVFACGDFHLSFDSSGNCKITPVTSGVNVVATSIGVEFGRFNTTSTGGSASGTFTMDVTTQPGYCSGDTHASVFGITYARQDNISTNAINAQVLTGVGPLSARTHADGLTGQAQAGDDSDRDSGSFIVPITAGTISVAWSWTVSTAAGTFTSAAPMFFYAGLVSTFRAR